MKQDSTVSKTNDGSLPPLIMGIDIGDRYSHYGVLDALGKVVEEDRIRTTPEAFRKRFSAGPSIRIAFETGTHSR